MQGIVLDLQFPGDGVGATRHGEAARRVNSDGCLAFAAVEPVGVRAADLDGPVARAGHCAAFQQQFARASKTYSPLLPASTRVRYPREGNAMTYLESCGPRGLIMPIDFLLESRRMLTCLSGW